MDWLTGFDDWLTDWFLWQTDRQTDSLADFDIWLTDWLFLWDFCGSMLMQVSKSWVPKWLNWFGVNQASSFKMNKKTWLWFKFKHLGEESIYKANRMRKMKASMQFVAKISEFDERRLKRWIQHLQYNGDCALPPGSRRWERKIIIRQSKLLVRNTKSKHLSSYSVELEKL